MLNKLPELPISTCNGRSFILPAEEYEFKKNAENGELYAVFPFNLYGKAHGNEDIVINTMDRRTEKMRLEVLVGHRTRLTGHTVEIR